MWLVIFFLVLIRPAGATPTEWEPTPEMVSQCAALEFDSPAQFEGCLGMLVQGAQVNALGPKGPSVGEVTRLRIGERSLPGEEPHPVHGSLQADSPGLRAEFRHALEGGDRRRAEGVARLLPTHLQGSASELAQLLGTSMPRAIGDAAAACARGSCFVQVADEARYRDGVSPASPAAPSRRPDEAVLVVQQELPSEFAILGQFGFAGLVFLDGHLVAIGDDRPSLFYRWSVEP